MSDRLKKRWQPFAAEGRQALILSVTPEDPERAGAMPLLRGLDHAGAASS